MRPQAPTAEGAAEPSPCRVLRCERIAAGPRAALIRVTLAAGEFDVASAQLVVVDGGVTARCAPLPSPVHAGPDGVTIGFAVTRNATPIGLVLGERPIALAETDARLEVERELADTRARLKEARSAYASIASARREAMRAAARAEVAAHDATARAEDLARRLESAGRRGWHAGLQRWRIAVAACALGPAAVLVVILAWPAGQGGENGVGGLVSASASADRPRVAAKPLVDKLALRLQIPASYLALYRQAATRYGLDWTRLAAVGAIESGHGQAQIAGVVTGTNADGASGPAQFLAGTWERYGLDGNADGARNPHDPADAIPAMASYLRASGAPQDWRAALRSYNHSDVYVDAVEKLAASLRVDAT